MQRPYVVVGKPRQNYQLKAAGAMQLQCGKARLGKWRCGATAVQNVLQDQGVTRLGTVRLRYNFSSDVRRRRCPRNRGKIFSVRFSMNPLFAEEHPVRQ